MNLTIDGQQVTAEAGETVLEVARRHGIDIPNLCTHPSLPPFGACRICVVEIEGMRGFPTSCTTPAAEDMVVHTQTEALQKLRRNILGLMMLEHPNACLICGRREACEEYRPKAEKVGRTTGCHTCNNKEFCDVRVLSEDLGLSELPVPPNYHLRPLERSDPFIDRDLNLCILCGRCVRICKHQHGYAVMDFVGRSSRTQIGEAFGRSMKEANCRFCGSCVDVCPTGTLADRYAKWFGRATSGVESTCQFCEAACALMIGAHDGKAVRAKAVNPELPVCVLGRFAIPEFLNGTERLQKPHIRVGKVLREVSWEEALAGTAEKLKAHVGNGFAFVCDAATPLEDRHVFRKFTKDVMQSDRFVEIEPDARGVSKAPLPEGTTAAYVTGNFVDTAALEGLGLLIVQDCYPTPASEGAQAVFPAAVFAETEGTIIDGEGRNRPLRQACKPVGDARAEWAIVQDLAQAMGAEGFAYASTAAIAEEAGIEAGELLAARDEAPAPALDPKLRRTYYRGHRISDKVHGLQELPMDQETAATPAAVAEAVTAPKGRFPIRAKTEIAPNVHEIVIEAPEIAKKAVPGQFCIAMADVESERVPYTLCDWDAEAGTITLVVQEKGQSSRKLILMREGDALAHVVGPLGIPLEIEHYGTVALAAGCYGVGAVLRIAQAMKEAGNKVIVIPEARSLYLHYYGDKLRAAADEFIEATIDGSSGVKGHAVDPLVAKLAAGEKIDRVIAIGCPFMMKITAEATKPYEVKTLAALNPIMVDGTGMCGACRVTVGDEVKFACVDGPFFDAHLVDWSEVRDRREAYSAEEIQSVGKTSSVEPHHHHGGRTCGCAKKAEV